MNEELKTGGLTMANEKRLIDAKAGKKVFSAIAQPAEYKGVIHMVVPISEIDKLPTVDAVPVVRCRECKYWGDEDGKLQDSDGVLCARCKIHNYLLDGRHTGWCPRENDFCSYGERKEGAD